MIEAKKQINKPKAVKISFTHPTPFFAAHQSDEKQK